MKQKIKIIDTLSDLDQILQSEILGPCKNQQLKKKGDLILGIFYFIIFY